MRAVPTIAAILLLGCPSHGPRAPMDRTAEANLHCDHDPSASTSPARPTKEQCLASPWNVAPDAKEIEGLSHFACDARNRSHAFTHAGTRELPPDEQVKFLEAHRTALHALPGVSGSGWGVCCDKGGPTGGCMHVSVDLCTTKVDELVRAFAGWLEADGLGDARMNLLVQLHGLTGPRCSSKEAPCGPVSYPGIPLDKAGYRCDGERRPISNKRLSWGSCAHDGECFQAGCGNQCVPWTEAARFGTCEGYPAMESAPAFCGCVDGACTWFEQ